jgi:FkbH-like protein
MYLLENKRLDFKKTVGSVEQWLAELSIRVRIEPLHQGNLQRAAQLLNKTNQMNLSTRRMSETELASWAEQENHKLWTLRVSDKFGDSGLTGIVSMEIQGRRAQIIDFILSCRVMGRNIEQVMLATAVDHARGLGIKHVYAQYIPTPKNKPCLDFFNGLTPRFERQGEMFSLPEEEHFACPAHIEIIRQQV